MLSASLNKDISLSMNATVVIEVCLNFQHRMASVRQHRKLDELQKTTLLTMTCEDLFRLEFREARIDFILPRQELDVAPW